MHNTEKPLVNNKLLTIYRFDIKSVGIQGGSIQFFKKNGNLRFRSVFLENYYLFEDKEYFCYVKQHLTMTFQNGEYFGFKVI